MRVRPGRIDMLGLGLELSSIEETVDRFMAYARQGERGYCCVTNVHQCVLVHDDPAFAARVNSATMVITDSTVLRRAASLRHGMPFSPVLRGVELMLELCRRAEAEGFAIALIGGRDDTVLAQLSQRLAERFPALRVGYAYSPPFRAHTPTERQTMLEGLARSGARICFVGLGCPKQENWMAEHTAEIDAMLIGVGAAFDANAGLVPPSPPWVHRSGLEWLYRLVAEPQRLWKRYAQTSPRFVWLMTLSALTRDRL
jgi:N-acetylglucosaminyldiphosphoundecaprenol N-acetyl-beta-D-mannosaminyltransferase